MVINTPAKRIAVIGLDCAPPEFLFDGGSNRFHLPNIRSLIQRGVHGELASTVPPITVPAWMTMMTSQDPGTLGIYGFRNRRDHSYDGLSFAASTSVTAPRLWDVLGEQGRQSITVGVPLTYPPQRLVGAQVSCFLTPDTNRTFTYPPSLGEEVHRVADGYMLDVPDFRTNDKERLLDQLYSMTEKQFRIAHHLTQTRPWDFFVMVAMAPDRIHHGFWRYMDPSHRLYEPGNPYEKAIEDYYLALDKHIGQFMDSLGDDTTVFIVSDHGAKRMDGGICLNEWLVQNGYLVLNQPVTEPTKFSVRLVNWDKTRVWGDGGYYGRIFLNVRGREPQGTVSSEEYEPLRNELIGKLEALGDEEGNPIGTKVYRPEAIYREVNGIAPDLIALFGNLYWRSIGQIGTGKVHSFENDTGPDDANHAEKGIFIAAGPGVPYQPQPIDGMELLDIAPTVLDLFGIERPAHYQGQSLVRRFYENATLSDEDEETIAKRLEDLGYL